MNRSRKSNSLKTRLVAKTTVWFMAIAFAVSGLAAFSIQSANAAATVAEVVNVDFTTGSQVGSVITNTAAGKLADITIKGAPTGFGTADGLSFPNNTANSTSNYLTGNLGVTTWMSKLELQLVGKFPDAGCQAQANGSILFGLGASSSVYTKYNIYRHSNFIGFDTFNSELYGVALPDNTSFHSYKFVMASKTAPITDQEIWIDGVKQTLAYQTTSAAVGTCSQLTATAETNANRVLAGGTGSYSSGAFMLMSHPVSANAWGTTGSIKSFSITTTSNYVVPSAPAFPTLVSGDRQLTVQFTPPSDGGSPITDYEYSIDSGVTWASLGTTTSPGIISNLTNGTFYTVKIRAVNSVGAGAASPSSSQAKPMAAPSAPRNLSVVSYPGQISVSFAAPLSNGGSTITNYKYSIDGGATYVTRSPISTSSPLVISGLTDGTVYSLRLLAVNAVGNGTPTDAINAQPGTVPTAPKITSVTAGYKQLTVNWTPSTSDGGVAISTYRYTTDGGQNWTDIGSTSPFVITGMTPGTSRTVFMTAVNTAGISPQSAGVAGIPYDVPGAPTINKIIPGPGQLEVWFSEGSTGYSPITNYKYSLDGGTTWTTRTDGTPRAIPLLIKGLPNGTLQNVQILAVNVAGDGASSNSLSGTPAAPPGAPTINSITPGFNSLTVAFTAPADNGGSQITSYKYSIYGSDWTTVPAGANPFTISGLVGSTYGIKVRAVNAKGDGTPSAAFLASPFEKAGAPTISSLVTTDKKLDIVFIAPYFLGGSTLSYYEYTLDGGLTWVSTGSTSTSISLSGLVNGSSFDVAVRAVTAAGPGLSTDPTSIIIGGVASAPTITSVVPSSSKLKIYFDAPSTDGGNPISDYKYSLDGGTSWISAGTTTGPIEVTGLVNGTTYSIKLRAVTSIGDGAMSDVKDGTPCTVSSAPTIFRTDAGDQILGVNFNAPSSDGGSAIVDYKYTIDGGLTWRSISSTSSPFVIPGLTNGVTYTIRIIAVNAAGDSAQSQPVTGTPVGAPASPTITGIVSENSKLTVNFQAPTNNGGIPVTGYKYSMDGGFTWVNLSSTSTTFTVTGLTNGTQYYFVMVALNSAGTSGQSVAVMGVPQMTIGTPAVTTVVIGNGKVTVTPSRGATGDAPASYTITASPGGASCTVVVPAVSCEITGLTNGTTYTFTTTATNAGGTSGSTAPTGGFKPLGAPGAPAITAVVKENSKLTISFTAPANNGGSVVTGYRYSTDDGVTWVSATSLTGPIVVTGLVNGTSYKLRLVAVNTIGTSVPSEQVIAVPQLTIGTPGLTKVVVDDERVTVTPSRGATGDAPASYTITASPGGASCTVVVPATSCLITGLSNGDPYTFTTTATNAGGTSGATLPTAEFIPVIPIPADGDGNKPPKKIASTGKFTTTNDSSFQVSWNKTSGKLIPQALGVYTGYVEAKITFVRRGITYTCTTQFGQLKAMPGKTAKDKAAAMKMKTFVGKQFCIDKTKLDPKTTSPKGGITPLNFKNIKPMNKTASELLQEKQALSALKTYVGTVEMEITRYRAWPSTMINLGNWDSKGGVIKPIARKTKISIG